MKCALGIKSNGKVLLRSRNNKDFNSKYPSVAKALAALPDETVTDGEIVMVHCVSRRTGSVGLLSSTYAPGKQTTRTIGLKTQINRREA